jgi:hypothetical protein
MTMMETVGRIADEQEMYPVIATAKDFAPIHDCWTGAMPSGYILSCVGVFLFGGCVWRSAAAWIGRKAAL